MSRYFDRLALRSGLTPNTGAGKHSIVSVQDGTGLAAAAGQSGIEADDAGQPLSLEVHEENVVDSNHVDAAPVKQDTSTDTRAAVAKSFRRDTDQQPVIPAEALSSKSENGAAAGNRPIPSTPATQPGRASSPVAAMSAHSFSPEAGVQPDPAPSSLYAENIKTPAIAEPLPADIAGTDHGTTESVHLAHDNFVHQREAYDRATESVTPGDSDTAQVRAQPIHAQSQPFDPDTLARQIPDAAQRSRERHASAVQAHYMVAGEEARKSGNGRPYEPGNIKISIGKIDLQVHQQQNDSIPVVKPVRSHTRPAPAASHSDMSRLYFRWEG